MEKKKRHLETLNILFNQMVEAAFFFGQLVKTYEENLNWKVFSLQIVKIETYLRWARNSYVHIKIFLWVKVLHI